MNESEISTPAAAPTPEPENATSEIACLQKQVGYLTVALLIVSMTVCVYMWRQARVTRMDLANFKTAAVQVLGNYQKDKPQWDAFVAKVAEYGKTHPDFAPIINKYKIAVAPAAPQSAPSAAPTLPTAPAQPK